MQPRPGFGQPGFGLAGFGQSGFGQGAPSGGASHAAQDAFGASPPAPSNAFGMQQSNAFGLAGQAQQQGAFAAVQPPLPGSAIPASQLASFPGPGSSAHASAFPSGRTNAFNGRSGQQSNTTSVGSPSGDPWPQPLGTGALARSLPTASNDGRQKTRQASSAAFGFSRGAAQPSGAFAQVARGSAALGHAVQPANTGLLPTQTERQRGSGQAPAPGHPVAAGSRPTNAFAAVATAPPAAAVAGTAPTQQTPAAAGSAFGGAAPGFGGALPGFASGAFAQQTRAPGAFDTPAAPAFPAANVTPAVTRAAGFGQTVSASAVPRVGMGRIQPVGISNAFGGASQPRGNAQRQAASGGEAGFQARRRTPPTSSTWVRPEARSNDSGYEAQASPPASRAVRGGAFATPSADEPPREDNAAGAEVARPAFLGGATFAGSKGPGRGARIVFEEPGSDDDGAMLQQETPQVRTRRAEPSPVKAALGGGDGATAALEEGKAARAQRQREQQRQVSERQQRQLERKVQALSEANQQLVVSERELRERVLSLRTGQLNAPSGVPTAIVPYTFELEAVSDDVLQSAMREENPRGSERQDLVGTCDGMCSQVEVEERLASQNFTRLELADGDPKFACKLFTRTLAGDTDAGDDDAPADMGNMAPERFRTKHGLLKTMQCLRAWMDGYRAPTEPYCRQQHGVDMVTLMGVVSDRHRSVRQDLRKQRINSTFAVLLLEEMARFLIMGLHELCDEPRYKDTFGIDKQQLGKTIISLNEMYDTHRDVGQPVESEPEFRAYTILLKTGHVDQNKYRDLSAHELPFYLPKLHTDVLASPEVMWALAVSRATRQNNPVLFFQLLQQATHVQACLCHLLFVEEMRKRLLEQLHTTRSPHGYHLPLYELRDMLFIDSDEKLLEWLALFNPIYGIDGQGRGCILLSRQFDDAGGVNNRSKRSAYIASKAGDMPQSELMTARLIAVPCAGDHHAQRKPAAFAPRARSKPPAENVSVRPTSTISTVMSTASAAPASMPLGERPPKTSIGHNFSPLSALTTSPETLAVPSNLPAGDAALRSQANDRQAPFGAMPALAAPAQESNIQALSTSASSQDAFARSQAELQMDMRMQQEAAARLKERAAAEAAQREVTRQQERERAQRERVQQLEQQKRARAEAERLQREARAEHERRRQEEEKLAQEARRQHLLREAAEREAERQRRAAQAEAARQAREAERRRQAMEHAEKLANRMRSLVATDAALNAFRAPSAGAAAAAAAAARSAQHLQSVRARLARAYAEQLQQQLLEHGPFKREDDAGPPIERPALAYSLPGGAAAAATPRTPLSVSAPSAPPSEDLTSYQSDTEVQLLPYTPPRTPQWRVGSAAEEDPPTDLRALLGAATPAGAAGRRGAAAPGSLPRGALAAPAPAVFAPAQRTPMPDARGRRDKTPSAVPADVPEDAGMLWDAQIDEVEVVPGETMCGGQCLATRAPIVRRTRDEDPELTKLIGRLKSAVYGKKQRLF